MNWQSKWFYLPLGGIRQEQQAIDRREAEAEERHGDGGEDEIDAV